MSEPESDIDETAMQGIDEIYESAAQFADLRDTGQEGTDCTDNMVCLL